MYSNNSSFDNQYFYNPLNSLSLDDQNLTLNNQSQISENPVILAKRTETIQLDEKLNKSIDQPASTPRRPSPAPSQKSIGQAPISTRQNPQIGQNSIIMEEEMHFQPPPIKKQISFAQNNIQSNNNILPQPSKFKQTEVFQEKLKPQNTAAGNSERKRPRIFEPLEENIQEQSFTKELSKISSSKQHKSHIQEQPINSVQDLLVQNSFFLATNFNETNVQAIIDKASGIVSRLKKSEQVVVKIKDLNSQIDEVTKQLRAKDEYLVEDGSEKKKKEQQKFQWFSLSKQILMLDYDKRLISQNDQNQEIKLDVLENEIDIIHQLQAAIDILTKLKPQIQLLKNNHNFIQQFQNYVQILKIGQNFENTKLKYELNGLIYKMHQKIRELHAEFNFDYNS